MVSLSSIGKAHSQRHDPVIIHYVRMVDRELSKTDADHEATPAHMDTVAESSRHWLQVALQHTEPSTASARKSKIIRKSKKKFLKTKPAPHRIYMTARLKNKQHHPGAASQYAPSRWRHGARAAPTNVGLLQNLGTAQLSGGSRPPLNRPLSPRDSVRFARR